MPGLDMLTNDSHHALPVVTASDAAALGVSSRGRWAKWRESIFGAVAKKGALGLIDQAVASGTRFVTTVLVGRACGEDQLGVYSLGFTLVILFVCLQESLITLPYTMLRHRWAGKRQTDYAGGALVQHGLLGITAFVLLAAFGLLVWAGVVHSPLMPVIWVLAGFVPLMLLREFARRYSFAHLRVRVALAIDVAVAIIQIGGLLWLAALDALTPGRAFVVVGLACGVASLPWLFLARGSFTFQKRRQWPAARRNWRMGKWVFAGQITGAMCTYSLYWLLYLTQDTAATGLYAACMTLVLLANPFLYGVSNILSPLAAKAVKSGGSGEARRLIGKATLLMVGAMTLFCGLLFVLGDFLVTALYGDRFAGQVAIITTLALGALAASASVVIDSGLYAIRRAEIAFHAGLASLVVTFALAIPLMATWGVLGAAISYLAGNVVLSAWEGIAFFRLTRTETGGAR